MGFFYNNPIIDLLITWWTQKLSCYSTESNIQIIFLFRLCWFFFSFLQWWRIVRPQICNMSLSLLVILKFINTCNCNLCFLTELEVLSQSVRIKLQHLKQKKQIRKQNMALFVFNAMLMSWPENICGRFESMTFFFNRNKKIEVDYCNVSAHLWT